MSVTDVTARIQQIQAQLALLSPSTTPGSAAAFDATLSRVGGASGTPATGATTGTGPSGGTGGAGGPTGADIVAQAREYLGVPYVWGGTDPKTGLDCSGLTQLVYGKFGIDLPRVSTDQAKAGRPVASLAQARPGDLLAFGSPVHHVAIYIGDNKMIEAPRPGLTVRVSEVYEAPTAIRRVLPEQAAGGTVGNDVPYAKLFNAAGARYDVSPPLLSAVAHQESGYDPAAVSPAGAQGLMQLMPGTAQGLGVSDPFNPAQAVDGAARLLRDLIDQFGRTDLALAAYNAGPGAVMKYDGIPPYPETQNYVKSVLGMLRGAA